MEEQDEQREDEQREDEQPAEEVEEQSFKVHRDDDSAEGSEDSDDDNEVDEQRFTGSDARLKRSISPIHPLA